jgi:hypothetical protein
MLQYTSAHASEINSRSAALCECWQLLTIDMDPFGGRPFLCTTTSTQQYNEAKAASTASEIARNKAIHALFKQENKMRMVSACIDGHHRGAHLL